jgi:hypothetical protein
MEKLPELDIRSDRAVATRQPSNGPAAQQAPNLHKTQRWRNIPARASSSRQSSANPPSASR